MFSTCTTPQKRTIQEVNPLYFRPDPENDDIKCIASSVRQYEFRGVPLFLDVGGITENPQSFRKVIDILIERYSKTVSIDAIAVLDARGFLFGPQLALHLGVPCVMIRKKGKLPGVTVSVPPYATEYSEDMLCVHASSVKAGMRFLVVDDIIATGGTLVAAAQLLLSLGATVAECAVVGSLDFLGGMDKFHQADEKLKDIPFFAVMNENALPPCSEDHDTKSANYEIGSVEYEIWRQTLIQ